MTKKRTTMPTTTSTTSTTISIDQLKEIDKKEMTNIRMAIPGPLDEIILKFQEAHRAANPDQRKETKEQIIWRMMIIGAQALNQEAQQLLQDATAE